VNGPPLYDIAQINEGVADLSQRLEIEPETLFNPLSYRFTPLMR